MPYHKTIIPIFVLLSASLLFGEVTTVHITHTSNDFEFGSYLYYDQVYLRHGEVSGKAGEPQLPSKPLHILVPPDAVIENISTEITRKTLFREDVNLFPAQSPHILPMPEVFIPEPTFSNPNPEIYSQNILLPEETFLHTKTGNLSGFKIASGIFYPLQYNPATKKLYIIKEATIEVQYHTGGTPPLHPTKRSQISLTIWENFVKQLVANPEDFTNFYFHYMAPMDDAYDYLIITDPTLVPVLNQVKDWKLASGLKDTIITTTEIYATYPGFDNAHKIREFIKEAYTNWGITWVLLAGDVNYVPARTVWAFDSEADIYEGENDIRADLYFSDLDGTWNFNANDTFGELGDSVDMYPEVFVGRASLETAVEMADWTAKLLNFEKTPTTDYLDKMLFLAMILWPNPYTDSGIAKDMIEEAYLPDHYTLTKLYESMGNENRETSMAAINEGQGFINHDGHASRMVLGVGEHYLWPTDMDTLSNGARQSIFYSIGCWPAAFDMNCIAEHYIANPDGGGVAFIGNSRYGWGSPGNPGYGYSEIYDDRFHDALFTRNMFTPGENIAFSKAYYAPYAAWENIWRWHQYEINLLGDPEMQLWTDNPNVVVVNYPDSVMHGGGVVSICVENPGGSPVKGARVALSQNSILLAAGVTNPTGCVLLDVLPVTPDSLLLTVTGKNVYPYQQWIEVITTSPYVSLRNWTLYDDTGTPLPGSQVAADDSLTLEIILKNVGTVLSERIATQIIPSEHMTVSEGWIDCGDLAPDDTFAITTAVLVDPALYNGEPAPVQLIISDAGGNRWEYILGIYIHAPDISQMYYEVTVSGSDVIVEPGENATIELFVLNAGSIEPLNPKISLSSDDPYLVVPADNYDITMFTPDSGVSDPIIIEVLGTAPATHLGMVNAQLTTDRGLTFASDFNFVIGNINFFDDMESGTGLWVTEGEGNLWHLTDRRAHSGNYSWWCGVDLTESYEDSLHCLLKTVPIIVGDNAELSFWLYYSVVNYGVDGIYVDIIHQSDTTRESYIGSGGALDSALAFTVGWMEYTYDLSCIPPGDTIGLLITMSSDNDGDVEEGFYIDDVSVNSQPVSFTLYSEDHKVVIDGFEIAKVFPNPFNNRMQVQVDLPEESAIDYRIYDLLGKSVYGQEVNLERGSHILTWDGLDKQGRAQPSGIYFIRISNGRQELLERVLYLK